MKKTHDPLISQAAELAETTPYSLESIRRLQRGLMDTDPDLPGQPLTETETLEAVPVALHLDLAGGGYTYIGGTLRMLKGRT